MPPTEHKLRAMKDQDDSIIPVTKPEDDVMDVLAEFETGLESLKALYVQRQKLQTRIREHEDQCKQREAAVAQRAAEIERAAQEQVQRMAELDAAKAALEQREKELSVARDAFKKQEAQSAKASEDAAGAKAKVLEEQAKKLAKEAEAIAKLTGSMNAHAQELEDARAAMKQEQQARQAERSQVELLRKQAEEQRAALESQEGHNRELAARVEAMGKQLDQAKQEALKYAQHAAQLESASSDGSAKSSQALAKANDALAKADARAEALQNKLTAIQAEFEAFKEQAERQAAAAKPLMPASTASMLRRRQRLKVYRDLVREQSLKVRRASDAIKKKVEACEQLLGQRSELAAIRDRVLEGERRLQRRRAGGRSVVTLLCALASFAIVAGLSWTAAREVAPATYMANSTIKAEGRGRDLNKAELDEWTNFHNSLLNDPMFHESAADRFKRAGYATLGTPEAVAQLIRNDFSSESNKPGEMQLHLKGQGSERTQHTLETFTAALASHANSQLQKRVDGGVTAVSAPASSDDEPLDNTRMLYFGGILMIGVVVCVTFVVALWKRLARAKTDFEQDTVVSDALDNPKWAAFAAAAAAQQGSMSVKNKAARE